MSENVSVTIKYARQCNKRISELQMQGALLVTDDSDCVKMKF